MKKINIDGIEVVVEDTDRYLQINDICGADLGRIWEQIKTDYRRYDRWFCYHNTEVPNAVLNEIGAVLADDNIEMHMTVGKLCDHITPDAVRLKDEDFNEFAVIHDQLNPEMYWSSERIGRDLSRWGIFILRSDNRIVGYILLSMWNPVQSEIYCIVASDKIQNEILIVSAVKYAFDNNKNDVLYMADKNTIAQKAASTVGFITTGFYKGYRVKCNE